MNKIYIILLLYYQSGFDRSKPIEQTYEEDYFWDRKLWNDARCTTGKLKLKTLDNFNKIFIGHTKVHDNKNKDAKPIFAGNLVWNLDTGAGYSGRLTMMNVETEEYFQSDFIPTLYPNDKAR